MVNHLLTATIHYQLNMLDLPHTILVVGCGDLGGEVAQQLAMQHLKPITDNWPPLNVIGVRRSATKMANMQCIQADVTQPDCIAQLQKIQPSIVLYCVAASGQTDAQYKAQYVDGLQNVLASQKDNAQLQHVFFVSSTRVYGQRTDAILDETTLAIPNDFGGERLLQAEQLLDAYHCNTTTLRLSGIYGPGRLRMINLAKSPAQWPIENSWTNRIHRDDAARFILFLIRNALNYKKPQNNTIKNCYIVTDSVPASQFEVLNWLAQQLNVDMQKIVGASHTIAQGKRLSNQGMLATGFVLNYPSYQVGYAALLMAL